jgi:hypothetical protein
MPPTPLSGTCRVRPLDRAAYPVNLATNQAKGMVSPAIACCASRASDARRERLVRARRRLAEVKPLAFFPAFNLSVLSDGVSLLCPALEDGARGMGAMRTDLDATRIGAVMLRSRCAATCGCKSAHGLWACRQGRSAERAPAWGASRLVTAGAGSDAGRAIRCNSFGLAASVQSVEGDTDRHVRF